MIKRWHLRFLACCGLDGDNQHVRRSGNHLVR
jgi:hypothetical protein